MQAVETEAHALGWVADRSPGHTPGELSTQLLLFAFLPAKSGLALMRFDSPSAQMQTCAINHDNFSETPSQKPAFGLCMSGWSCRVQAMTSQASYGVFCNLLLQS